MRRPPALALRGARHRRIGGGRLLVQQHHDEAVPSRRAAAAFPVTVGDVTLSQKPTHIVSLSPTATDMLFAIGAGTQVVATDKNSDDSDFHGQAKPAKTDLDSYTPSAEAIAATNPDLVVISNDTNKIKDQLTTLKIPVYVAAGRGHHRRHLQAGDRARSADRPDAPAPPRWSPTRRSRSPTRSPVCRPAASS